MHKTRLKLLIKLSDTIKVFFVIYITERPQKFDDLAINEIQYREIQKSIMSGTWIDDEWAELMPKNKSFLNQGFDSDILLFQCCTNKTTSFIQ